MADKVQESSFGAIKFHDNGDGTFAPYYAATGDITNVQRISAGFMAPGQSAKQYVGKQLTSTGGIVTVALETVTTGKTFYVTDLMIATDVASGTQILDVRLQAAGVDIFRAPLHNLTPVQMAGMETQPFASTGQAVTFVLPTTAGGAVNVYFFVAGFEQ